MLEVLSLGAGVQSSTVLLMSCKGELPKLDHAIFADTGWEPPDVYTHLEFLKGEAAKAGIPVHIVRASGKNTTGNILEDTKRSQVRGSVDEKGGRWASMPFRTKDPVTGKEGMIRRQCTSEYKIYPLRKKQRELIGLKPRQHAPKEIVMRVWIGISFDETQRIKDSDVRWAENHYPLVYDFNPPMTRAMCLRWLHNNGYPIAPRSACIACPYHSNAEWRDMKMNRPDEWKQAVDFDNMIRKMGGMRGDCFVHRDLKPLEDIDFRNEFDRGQLAMFDMGGFGEECEGMCGL